MCSSDLLHAIVSAVMDGIAQPRLLVKGAASPHDYAMRPSDAAALNDADLIVWIGEVFETFLAKPLEALAGNAEVVTLIELAGADGDPHIWLDPADRKSTRLNSSHKPSSYAVYCLKKKKMP